MPLSSKIKSLFWFIKRPEYLPHAMYILRAKFKPNLEIYRDASTKWANENVMKDEEILLALEIVNFEKVRDQFPKIFKEADLAVLACPVEMGGEGNLDLIYNLARAYCSGDALETGVAYGWSSLAILLALKEHEFKLHSIDLPYLQADNDLMVGCAVPEVLKNKWELYRGSDRMHLKRIFKQHKNISFIHYDSDKSYHGRAWAYPLLWNNLKSGGIFISDDIQDNFAFRDFCKEQNLTPLISEYQNKYVGILVKP